MGLFRAGGAAALGHATDRGVLRSRRTELAGAAWLGEAVTLDLFADTRLVALADGPVAEGRVWHGSVAGDPGSEVRLHRRGAALVGTVRTGGALFRISPTAGGEHVIEQIDESALPGCVGDVQVPAGAGEAGEVGGGSPGSSGSGSAGMAEDAGPVQIDVLVVFTPEARAAMGSEDAVLALIDLAVDEANAAYVDSQVAVQLNLVHAAEIDFEETGNFSQDLASLRADGDGLGDEVHDLREVHGADLVSMIVASSAYCGVAYVMGNPGPGFESHGFSVVSRSCAAGYYSFAHELGHNMGCMHDHQHSGSGAYPYSYGRRNSTSSWRTIMAYSPGSRIRRFSNPDVTYQGEPTGTPEGHPEPADNARTIAETASIVAGFRDAGTLAYGTGKPTSVGILPTLSWDGSPSMSAGSFQLVLAHAVPDQFGIVHRGVAPADMPFRGGTLLVAPPVVGVRTFHTGLDGSTALPIPVTVDNVGTTDYFQFLFRDPGLADGTSVGMTNGVKVTYVP